MEFKRKSCFALMVCILLTNVLSFNNISYASNSISSSLNSDFNAIEFNGMVEEMIQEIEGEGINIRIELENQVEFYEDLLLNEDDVENQEKLRSLLNTSNDLLEFYKEYEIEKNNELFSIDPGRSAVKAAIAAIVAYFNTNGYFLAAELLLHAQDNTKEDSEYCPYFDSHFRGSPVIRRIKRSSSSRGSDEFPKDGTTEGNDLYYAIHYFKWVKPDSSNRVTVIDRYDYQVADYDGIQNYAVDAMFWAQQFGYIVPFQVRVYDI